MYRLILFPTLATFFAIAIASIVSRPQGIEKYQGLMSCNAAPNLDSIKNMHATWVALETSANTSHLSETIRLAHQQGIKILLLTSHHWRPEFMSHDSTRISNASFSMYERNLIQVAIWAQRNEVDALSLGQSFSESNPDIRRWKFLIKKIRIAYHGTLMYFADHREELQKVKFWDKLDFIGVVVPISSANKSNRRSATATWSQIQLDIAKVITKFQKPVVLLDTSAEVSSNNSASYDVFFKEIWPSNWLAGAYIQLPCVTQKDGLQFPQETIARNFSRHEKRH